MIKEISIPELDDFEGSISDLSEALYGLAKKYGPNAKIKVDGGDHVNVGFIVEPARNLGPMSEMDNIVGDDPPFWDVVKAMRDRAGIVAEIPVLCKQVVQWADQLESTNTALLADVYEHCADGIRRLVEEDELPASVIESFDVLLAYYRKKVDRKRKRAASW